MSAMASQITSVSFVCQTDYLPGDSYYRQLEWHLEWLPWWSSKRWWLIKYSVWELCSTSQELCTRVCYFCCGLLQVNSNTSSKGYISGAVVQSWDCQWNIPKSTWYSADHDRWFNMIRSSPGNIFRVTGRLCGTFTGHRWIPITKASDANAPG